MTEANYSQFEPDMIHIPIINFGLVPINNIGLDNAMLSLTRSAALKSFKSANLLSGVACCADDDVAEKIELEVEKELLQGLNFGGLSAISNKKFERDLYNILTAQLSGVFDKIKSGIKKLGSKLNPVKLVKKTAKAVRKVASKAARVIKKVAPVALATAALAFGVPHIWSGLKFLGSKTIAGAKFLGSKIKKSGRKIEKKLKSWVGDEMNSAASDIATDIAAKNGVSMQSDAAQDVLKSYMLDQQQKMAEMQAANSIPYSADQTQSAEAQEDQIEEGAEEAGGEETKEFLPWLILGGLVLYGVAA
jgi:hypothetical protein